MKLRAKKIKKKEDSRCVSRQKVISEGFSGVSPGILDQNRQKCREIICETKLGT